MMRFAMLLLLVAQGVQASESPEELELRLLDRDFAQLVQAMHDSAYANCVIEDDINALTPEHGFKPYEAGRGVWTVGQNSGNMNQGYVCLQSEAQGYMAYAVRGFIARHTVITANSCGSTVSEVIDSGSPTFITWWLPAKTFPLDCFIGGGL
jgi:hypothetical protein